MTNGRILGSLVLMPALLSLTPGDRLRVPTTGPGTHSAREAAYTIEAVPLLTSPGWMAEGNRANVEFGYSVASAGDVNGDGYDDVIVGAPFYDDGQADEGRAEVFYGAASGLSFLPAWRTESGQVGARFGQAVSSAGDVNGDGFADVLVGAPGWGGGRALLYLGSASGLGTTPAWIQTGTGASMLGFSLAGAGDVNHDGFDDIIVGAPRSSFLLCVGPNGVYLAPDGKAFLFLGSPSGLSTFAAWVVQAKECGAQFGAGVSFAGDVNGDAYDDVIVLEGARGRASVFFGASPVPAGGPVWAAGGGLSGIPSAVAAVASAGDVNGDRFDDLILGSPGYTNGQDAEGAVFVFLGGPTLADSPVWTVEGNQSGASLGQSVATTGDLDGDGFHDVIVGGLTAAFVYQGSATGLATSAVWSVYGSQAGDRFGFSVASAGDVNGDARFEVLVGAPSHTNDQSLEGRAFLFSGTAPPATCTDHDRDGYGLPASPSCQADFFQDCDDDNQAVHPGAVELCNGADEDCDGDIDEDFSLGLTCTVGVGLCESTGTTVCAPDGAGTVCNGVPGIPSAEICDGRDNDCDGLMDDGLSHCWVVVGQAAETLGYSVAGAGDVNHDGYDDLLVGAPLSSFGDGRVLLYYGSASGASRAPDFVATGPHRGSIGSSVAGAGDINGDGFSDFIVGGNGRVFVYLGSASGPRLATSLSGVGGSDGTPVASAGDVNGDGFDDVIVGAPVQYVYYDVSPTVSVFTGSAQGLASTPAWTVTGQPRSGFAVSVSSAGDINDDGFDDVIVGARIENKAYVFHGSAQGLSTSPATVLSGPSGAAVSYGLSVSSAGDVDGDRFDDVIVGDPAFDLALDPTFLRMKGKAFLYLGSSAGLDPTPAWSFEGGPGYGRLGNSVHGGGDMNGDGLADVVVGAPGSKLSHAFAFFGSGAGPSAAPSWTRSLVDPFQAFFGWSAAFAGDIDGDGGDDIIVGAPYAMQSAGEVFLYYARDAQCQDADGDGFGSAADGSCPPVDDCNDADPLISPADGEPCDGRDNNCNGRIDEDSSDAGAGCTTGLLGLCLPGNAACLNGSLVCQQTYQESEEICDGLDNDCDGSIDEGDPGGGQLCYGGGFGVCARGLTTCVAGYSVCQLTNSPSPEVCDDLDNDCDGAVDDNVPEAGQSCDTGLPGVCSSGITECSRGRLTCLASSPSPEVCDGLDNDCDGVVDDGVCDQIFGITITFRSSLGKGSGLVTWRTDFESTLAGFNLVVVDAQGEPVRQNSALIACEECVTLQGHTYSYIVPKHRSGRDVYVEVVHLDGSTHLFGPAVKD